jgi:hypothetical protein
MKMSTLYGFTSDAIVVFYVQSYAHSCDARRRYENGNQIFSVG